jgi:DNA repair exonuclease SbcCD ATPase subunit
MEEIAPSQNKSELNLFKEDILSLLRQLENKLNNQISNKESKLNKDYDHFISKINSLIENNKEMVNDLVSQKLKLEKINELETFKNKVDSMLITHEVRIKNSLEDIEKMKTKYDKIITENLFVSGFIGNSCQFKNLSEYLSYNISEVSKLKMEREQYKKDIKEI